MSSYTAIDLVNRVLASLKDSDVSDLSTQKAVHILRILNEAKDDVLEANAWDFDSRDTGVLNTQPMVSAGTISVTNGQTAISTSAPDMLPVGDFQTWLLFTSDPTYAETATRLVWHSSMSGELDAPWIGMTDPVASYQAVVYEYRLPDTVKDVLSVRHQHRKIDLQIIGRDEVFNRVIPSPTDRLQDTPELVVVGRQVVPTYAGVPVDPGLGMIVWPPTETALRISYSYTVRHPQLSDSVGLENVPERAVHDIIRKTVALAHATPIANDPELSALNERIAMRRILAHKAHDNADPQRPNVLPSLDRKTTRYRSGPRDPNVFYRP